MPAVYFVRHGQASFGSDDYDVLSELGHRQATIAGQELVRRGARDPLIVSGTLRRQRDTAAAIAAAFGGCSLATDARWNEIDAHGMVDARLGGPGASAGITSLAFQEHLDAHLLEWVGEEHAGWLEFSGGIGSALRELVESLPRGRDAVVATSAAVVAALGTVLLTGSADTFVALNRVSVNASISTVAASARRLSLLSINDHAHLLGQPGLLTYR